MINGGMEVPANDADARSCSGEERPESPSSGEEDPDNRDEDYQVETSSPNKRGMKRKTKDQNSLKSPSIKYTYSELYFDLTYETLDPKEEEEDSPDNFRFFATTKCKRLLYLKGYVYNLNRLLDRVTYWRCQQKSCRGCAVLKPKDGKSGVNWHQVGADKLISSRNFNEKAHSHPPYLSFDVMVHFYDDRWAKIKKNIRVGGQKLGRFLREGEVIPKREAKSARKMRQMQQVLRDNLKWKKRRTNVANESNCGVTLGTSFQELPSRMSEDGFQLPATSGYEPQGSGSEVVPRDSPNDSATEMVVPSDTSALDNNQMTSKGEERPPTSWDVSYSEKYYDLNYDETASSDEDSSPFPENFRFFSTSKCKKLLYLNGFVYCLNRVRVVNSYWRCQIRGCCGCAVLKKEAANQTQFKDMKTTESLIVCKNFHQKLHCHPPFLSFDIMVQFFDDRWEKIKKNIKIGGQRFGRFVHEGQPPPKKSQPKKPFPNFGFKVPNALPNEDPETLANIVCHLYNNNKNGKILFVEGSLYLLSKINADREYWRCRNRPCRATVATRLKDGAYRVIAKGGYHIHPLAATYEEALNERAKVTKMVRERQEMGLSPNMIALEEERMGEDGRVEAANYFEQSLEPSGIDNGDSEYSIGDAFDDAEDQMKEEIIVLENCLTESGEKFLREIVMADDGTKILVFVTGKNIEYLSAASTWAMDSVRGTKMPNLFTHLFIIRARVRFGEALPLAYALLTSGTQDAFRALFIVSTINRLTTKFATCVPKPNISKKPLI